MIPCRPHLYLAMQSGQPVCNPARVASLGHALMQWRTWRPTRICSQQIGRGKGLYEAVSAPSQVAGITHAKTTVVHTQHLRHISLKNFYSCMLRGVSEIPRDMQNSDSLTLGTNPTRGGRPLEWWPSSEHRRSLGKIPVSSRCFVSDNSIRQFGE